jgi:hypothetical protein
LSIFGAPKIHAVRAQSGHQRFEWAWPGASYVNCAKVEIIGPNGDLLNNTIAYRKTSKSGLTLPIDSTYPASSVLQLSLGLVTPNKQFVFCPLVGEASIATSNAMPSGAGSTSESPSIIEVAERMWTPIEPRESTVEELPPDEPEAEEEIVDLTLPQVGRERTGFFGRFASRLKQLSQRSS